MELARDNLSVLLNGKITRSDQQFDSKLSQEFFSLWGTWSVLHESNMGDAENSNSKHARGRYTFLE
jgi:hypothetical protein